MKTKMHLILLLLAPVLLVTDLSCQVLPKRSAPYRQLQMLPMQQEVQAWKFLHAESAAGPAYLALEPDRIVLQSDTGAAKSIPLPPHFVEFSASRSGRDFGVVSVVSRSKNPRTEKIVHLRVYSLSGNPLYDLKRPRYFDEPMPSYVISDADGRAIIGVNATGQLYFYDTGGNLLREVTLFRDAEYDLERILQMDVSEDGNSVAVLASKRGSAPLDSDAPNPSGEPHLFLFDREGRELWRKPLPETSAGQLALSPDGQYLLASTYSVDMKGHIFKGTSIVDRNAREIGRVTALFRVADFAPAAHLAFLADRNRAVLIDLKTGTARWEYLLSRKQGMIAAVDLAHDAEQVVLLAAKNQYEGHRFVFTDPLVFILDGTGKEIQSIQVEDAKFLSPALMLNENDGKIYLGFSRSLQIYGAQK